MNWGLFLKKCMVMQEDKMQVASIHIFGIKYGKNIIENEFKAPDIIKTAGLNESYSTELQKALNIYRCLDKIHTESLFLVVIMRWKKIKSLLSVKQEQKIFFFMVSQVLEKVMK